MSTGSRFLNDLYSGKRLAVRDLAAEVLLHSEAYSLAEALRNDAASYFYSSAVTFSCGVASLETKHYSWATVHFYYSVFYTVRSSLAADGHCLFYYDGKPFVIEAKPMSSPVRKNGPSHVIAVDEFTRLFPGDSAVTGEIFADPALEWIKSKREEANYRTERFPDPELPPHFSILQRYSLRQLVEKYAKDTSYQWEFDPDHATLALPLSMLVRLRDRLSAKDIDATMSAAEKTFLQQGLSDSAGPINALLQTCGIG